MDLWTTPDSGATGFPGCRGVRGGPSGRRSSCVRISRFTPCRSSVGAWSGASGVGITEHNDVSWIDELRAVARKIGPHLLPGFEVESAEGIHVLCLFDSDTPGPHLESTLARLGPPRPSARSPAWSLGRVSISPIWWNWFRTSAAGSTGEPIYARERLPGYILTSDARSLDRIGSVSTGSRWTPSA